jgi:Arc/MetJ family transcription regulator
MHMRTTLNLDSHLLSEASRLTGVEGKTTLIHMGLESLIRREAARRLAAMAGIDPRASAPPRRRSRTRKA